VIALALWEPSVLA